MVLETVAAVEPWELHLNFHEEAEVECSQELADHREVPPSWPRQEEMPFGFGFVSLKKRGGDGCPIHSFMFGEGYDHLSLLTFREVLLSVKRG